MLAGPQLAVAGSLVQPVVYRPQMPSSGLLCSRCVVVVSVGWDWVARVWPGHLSQVLTKGLSLVAAKGLSLEVCAMEAAVAAIH